MLVTVVRSKTDGIVQLPEGVNIRPRNFVEIKTLSPAMKKALVVLEKAGTIDVAQVADVSAEMMEGSIENRLPSDTTGSMAALFVSEKTHRDVKARTKNIPDILTDYSKVHAVSEEELQSEVEVEGEETEEGEEVNPIFENQLPLNFEEASERLGKEEVAKLEKSVDDLEESKSTKVAPVPA